MQRRIKFILCGLAVFLIGVFLILFVFGWFLKKQERVLVGTARPDFPYGDYSLAELNKLYAQYPENNAPTVQSPEQTHVMFLAALKKGDFDEAVRCCFREGDRVKTKEFLEGVEKRGQLELMIGDLGTIHKDTENSWTANYIYSGTYKGEKIANFITFIKDSKGIWYIENL